MRTVRATVKAENVIESPLEQISITDETHVDSVSATPTVTVRKLTPDAQQALYRIPYLTTLPASELATFADVCSLRRAKRGSTIFEEGAPPAGVFLILEGRVKIVRTSRRGREQVLHEEIVGATLGEIPVFDGEGYVGSAVAVESSTLVFIPRAPLLTLLARHPASAQAVIQILSRRLRRFVLLATTLSFRPVRARLALYLIGGSGGATTTTIELPITREALAAHLGTVREEVSRALSALRRQRLIEVDGRSVRVLDLAKLRQVAGE